MPEIDFDLEDIQKKAIADPRHFLPPKKNALAALKIGDIVQITCLLHSPPAKGFEKERLRLTITERDDDILTGQINDQPHVVLSIKKGDVLRFRLNHVTATAEKSAFDPQQHALITGRAQKARTINRATRTAITTHDDSGWRFFYGNEVPSEINNHDNWQRLTLAEAIYYEPHLSTILHQTGDFYYDTKQNRYLKKII